MSSTSAVILVQISFYEEPLSGGTIYFAINLLFDLFPRRVVPFVSLIACDKYPIPTLVRVHFHLK